MFNAVSADGRTIVKVSWSKKSHLKPGIVLSKMERAKTINVHGKAAFGLFEFEDARAALDTMVEINGKLGEFAKGRIISAGLSKAAAAGVLTSESLLTAMNEELRKHLKIRPSGFILSTSLSIAGALPLKSFDALDCKVQFLPGGFPRAFASREAFDAQWRKSTEPEHTPFDYCKVLISCTARLSHDAVFMCQEALDLFRAFASFLENSQMSLAWSGDPGPINKVMLGGLHALHREDGSLAEDFYWYEPNFRKRAVHQINAHRGSVHAKNYRWMLARFGRLPNPIRRRLKDALLLYVRAFDEQDRNSALIRGWRAIETILGSGDNCEPVARRCAFLYEDFDYNRQIVDHLRECRNRSAHMGRDLADASIHCFQLQRYFRQAVLFHLNNAGRFETLDEANAFLDLPSDANTLRRRGAMIRKAIKFKTPRG